MSVSCFSHAGQTLADGDVLDLNATTAILRVLMNRSNQSLQNLVTTTDTSTTSTSGTGGSSSSRDSDDRLPYAAELQQAAAFVTAACRLYSRLIVDPLLTDRASSLSLLLRANISMMAASTMALIRCLFIHPSRLLLQVPRLMAFDLLLTVQEVRRVGDTYSRYLRGFGWLF